MLMNQTIFISNLHEMETQENILRIFCEFAPVQLCHVFMNQARCRGFGLVSFLRQKDKDRALNKGKHFASMGRLIKIQEYIDDNDKLTEMDSAEGALKICVLGIPQWIGESQLKQIIQRRFGSLQHAYINKDAEKHKYVGFVTFCSASQVEMAVAAKVLKIDKSETLILKPFTTRPKKRLNLERLIESI